MIPALLLAAAVATSPPGCEIGEDGRVTCDTSAIVPLDPMPSEMAEWPHDPMSVIPVAPAPAYQPKGDWSVPITIGHMQHLDFTFGLGGQYTWRKNGVSLAFQGTSARLDSFKGKVTGRGIDRWPPVTLDWRRPSETIYGGAITLTIPVNWK